MQIKLVLKNISCWIISIEAFTDFHISEMCVLHFTQNPWIDNDGKPVTVGKVTMLKSMHSFHRYITLRYLLPLCLLKVVNVIFCKAFAGTYNNLKQKIDLVLG